MHEALLYKKLENNKVNCIVCSQKCIIPSNNTGICGVRYNKESKLYLLVYGRASAANTDPIEKKPLYHFLPGTEILSIGTVGCNFSCRFCQNYDISQVTKDLKLKLIKEKKPELTEIEVSKYGYDLPPEKIIEICKENKIPSIAYTYNEPAIFFEYLYDTSKLSKKLNIKNVLVSNGYESEEAMNMLKPYIDAMNIDLKSFTNEFYIKTCQAKLEPVLKTIKLAHKMNIWVEITTLLIPNMNDSENELKKIAEFIASIDINIPWHISAFHPDYQMTDIEPTSYSSLFKAYEIGKKIGLKYIYIGNILDETHSNTYCPKCNALLIRRYGYSIHVINLKDGKCSKCKEKILGIWK